MNLTDEQKQRVKSWIEQGAKLGEIQNRLASELSIKLTYMDTRFLVDDLKLVPKDPEPPKVAEPPAAAKPPLTTKPVPAGEAGEDELPLPPAGGGRVSVTVD